MEASGLIGFVKPRKTAKGLTTYSFTLDDRDDERWFGTYDKEPAEAGTYVTFEYVTNAAGFNNVDNKTMKVTQEGPATPDFDDDIPDSVAGKPAPAKAAAAYGKATNRDANINWQSARNASTALLDVANAAGALDLGTGKKGSKLDALVVIHNRLTLDLYNHAMEVNATGEVPADFQG
jgi:hypothetical protein